MKFDLNKSFEILERTPAVLETMLSGLSEEWSHTNEGGETWSPFDVVGHLIHGENTDWIQRMEIILNETGDKQFKPFDRFAQFHECKGKSLNDLLAEFKKIRSKNIAIVRSWNLKETDFSKKGIHPAFGEVSLSQLLATWTAHDLGHLAQVARVMAKRYKEEVGPWLEYLRILKE
jgi:hypothetical protein